MIGEKSQLVIGYVFNKFGMYDRKHYIYADIENITNFIMVNEDYCCYITDDGDNLILTTMEGGYIDKCFDTKYLKEILLPTIIPKQDKKAEIKKVRYHEGFYSDKELKQMKLSKHGKSAMFTK